MLRLELIRLRVNGYVLAFNRDPRLPLLQRDLTLSIIIESITNIVNF